MAIRMLLAGTALMLGSCSFGYDLVARVDGGRIVFDASDARPGWFFGELCVSGVHVTSDEETGVLPEPGDDEALVTNGRAAWWVEENANQCMESLPIAYGRTPAHSRVRVAAKPLKPGVVYRVSTGGHGGYGSGRFRLSRDGRVENLGPSPAFDGAPTG